MWRDYGLSCIYKLIRSRRSGGKNRESRHFMPRVVSDREVEMVVEAVVRSPGGELGIDDLHQALAAKISRRTLQRRVASLVASGRLVRVGRGRAARYRLASTIVAAKGEARGTSTAAGRGEEIPTFLSAEGQELEALVRRPLAQRTPVGYQREFLDRYV